MDIPSPSNKDPNIVQRYFKVRQAIKNPKPAVIQGPHVAVFKNSGLDNQNIVPNTKTVKVVVATKTNDLVKAIIKNLVIYM